MWDWDSRRCLECSKGYVFNLNGVCAKVSDLCRSSDTSGLCLSCYKGYDLINGQCAERIDDGPTDLGCAKWDWDNRRC